MDRGGRLTRFNKKFAGFVKSLRSDRISQRRDDADVTARSAYLL